jgi:hypothetical protein
MLLRGHETYLQCSTEPARIAQHLGIFLAFSFKDFIPHSRSTAMQLMRRVGKDALPSPTTTRF